MKISIILLDLNYTAQYMAIYGFENLGSFIQAPGIFESLQHYLDRDMGMALPYLEFELFR